MRILVIEPDQVLGNAICNSLRHHDHDVELAKDDLMALRWLKNQAVDLVILDFDTPANFGEMTLKKIRAKHIALTIMAVDRYNNPYGETKLLNLGATHYASRPFDLNEFCARIGPITERTSLR